MDIRANENRKYAMLTDLIFMAVRDLILAVIAGGTGLDPFH